MNRKMDLARQYEVYGVINKIITILERRERKKSYQKKYYNNNKEIFKKASKKYHKSEKGKKTMKRYCQSEKGKESIRKSGKKWREKNPEKMKEIINRSQRKKREKILKRREEEDIVPTVVGGAGEILLKGYKRRNWTKKEEDILRECKRRSKSPYKASMTWKQIGILLNRPQKSIRGKWRRMIEQDMEDSDEEIILLQSNIGI
tara:strand:+ start:229 stop:837 length:609 start_codon:yes stop_codon:yes gene_type:complete